MIDRLQLQRAIDHCERAISACEGNPAMELHREIYATCLEALSAQKEENFTCYGYNVTDIALIADMIHKHGITPDDIKKAVDNFAFAASMIKIVISSEISNEFDKATRFTVQNVCDPGIPQNIQLKKNIHLIHNDGRTVTFRRFDPRDLQPFEDVEKSKKGDDQNGEPDT